MKSEERILLSHPRFELKKSASGMGFSLSGDLNAGGAARVLEEIKTQVLDAGSMGLDLEELELMDGVAVARMVDLIRLLLSASEQVKVFKSPQSLAHTLYRAGMLEGASRLKLIEPREEEGTTN